MIEYSYKLINFYEILKPTVDTPFESKEKELRYYKTSPQFKNYLRSNISSNDDIIVQECILPDLDCLRSRYVNVSLLKIF